MLRDGWNGKISEVFNYYNMENRLEEMDNGIFFYTFF